MSSFKKSPNCDQYQNILSRTVKNHLPSLCGLSPESPTFVNYSVLLSLALCRCPVGNAPLGQGTVLLGVGNEV